MGLRSPAGLGFLKVASPTVLGLRVWGVGFVNSVDTWRHPEPCTLAALERRGNNFKGLKDLYLNATARIWP